MRSGLESTSGDSYGSWVRSRNWVRYALGRPMVSDPGSSMEYSTGTSHLLSAILTKATKTSTHDFARDALARPLGITLARWPRDPQGIYLRRQRDADDPAADARGRRALPESRRARGGRQVVPAAWVETSCTPRTRSRWDSGSRSTGTAGGSRLFGGQRACFAWGFGGQYIFVFRDLELVVVVTSSTAGDDERRGYRRQLFDLLETHILRTSLPVQ